ncbi:MAG: amidohydrolase family protein [Myxococcales bacterium]|nr:amidohydrolase family protein [Myxococcales bacterium]
MDLLIRNGTLVPVEADDPGRAFAGDLWVRDGRIAAMGPSPTVARAMREAGAPPMRVLEARGCAVLPGFVQTHVHLCQVLFRGMADDLPLLTWLKERIWPLEAAHDPQSLRASADLGLAELLKGGTTTLLDMGTVHHHDAVFEALYDSGMRAFSGKTLMDAGLDVPDGLRETTDEALAESDRLADRWHNADDGRLGYAYAPRFILSCTEALFRGALTRARARGCRLHTHAAEHPGERAAVNAVYGCDDVEQLEKWGFVGPDVVIAHGVQLTPAQRRAMARSKTRVTHCPSANMKLGSGVAKVVKMQRAGIVMGLGADGAPCNNNLDGWVEMRHAALLAKRLDRTTDLPAPEVLKLATLDGARCLGIDDQVGSLALGKKADIQVVSLGGVHQEPGGSTVARLVYATQSRDVRHVLVGGRLVVRDGRLLSLDEDAVLDRARHEARSLCRRAGLSIEG